jgi:hypothetical protein
MIFFQHYLTAIVGAFIANGEGTVIVETPIGRREWDVRLCREV